MLAGFEPVVVDPFQARVGRKFQHRFELQHPLEQLGEFVLPRARHEEVPERAKAAALVRVGDQVAFAQDVLQQLPLAAVPQRDAFTHPPVEAAEVVLDLAEVGQQLARERRELGEALLHRGIAEQRHVAGLDPRDLGVDLGALAVQLGQPHLRVGLAALVHLAQQVEQGQQARLGADEAARLQAGQPGDGAFGRRGQVEVRLVRAGGVELAQPGALVGRPVVQVLGRGLRVGRASALFAQRVQRIFQRLGQVGLPEHAHVGQHEDAVQEARHQRRRIGREQPPGRVLAAQGFQGFEVEWHGRNGAARIVDARRRGPRLTPSPSGRGQG